MARKVFVTSDMSADEDLDEIADSNPLAALIWPWFLTSCDDWGRTQASPRRLKNRVFPGNALVGHEEIERALELYEQHGLITRYEVDGVAYFAVPSERWFKWQTHIPREKRASEGSKCPPPPGSPRGPQQPRGTQSPHADSSDNSLIAAELSEGEPKKVPTPTPSLSPAPSPPPSDPDDVSTARAQENSPPQQESNVVVDQDSLSVDRSEELTEEATTHLTVAEILQLDEDPERLEILGTVLRDLKTVRDPVLEARQWRLKYAGTYGAPQRRLLSFIEWLKREETRGRLRIVGSENPTTPAPSVDRYPASGVPIWDELLACWAEMNANECLGRCLVDYDFEKLTPLSFDGHTLRIRTPWDAEHYLRHRWHNEIKQDLVNLGHYDPIEVEWVYEPVEAMA